jgi:hypothetical protein
MWPIATASRWIEILAVVLREGVTNEDAIDQALQKWSRSTIFARSQGAARPRIDLSSPAIAEATHRYRWIAIGRLLSRAG